MADARELVDTVCACAFVLARVSGAFVDIDVARGAFPSWVALARVGSVGVGAVSVVAECPNGALVDVCACYAVSLVSIFACACEVAFCVVACGVCVAVVRTAGALVDVDAYA